MAGTDRSEEVHAAIRAALIGDATIAGLLATRVFDGVPQDAACPFCALTIEAAAPYDGTALDGMEYLARLDIHDTLEGSTARIYAISRQVYALLHDEILTLSAGRMVNMRLEPGGSPSRIQRDDNAKDVWRTMRFRVVTQD